MKQYFVLFRRDKLSPIETMIAIGHGKYIREELKKSNLVVCCHPFRVEKLDEVMSLDYQKFRKRFGQASWHTYVYLHNEFKIENANGPLPYENIKTIK